ncbi:hypothetical protein PP427_gp034 [Salmonella phage KM16]|uniref:hypothetical protein n=1 Tax=Salmonella phage KM16 TaxID=2797303 RepID=UPI002492C290|nr:hypothetical protein PP427_gp034 [Salmonella phage KM16]
MKWELGKTYAFANTDTFQSGTNARIREVIESNTDGLFQVSRLDKERYHEEFQVSEVVLSNGAIVDTNVAREMYGFNCDELFLLFENERKHFKEVECNRDFKSPIDDCVYEVEEDVAEAEMPKIEVEGRIVIGSISSEADRLWLIDSLNRIKFK